MSNGKKFNSGDTADFTQSDVYGTNQPGDTATLSPTDITIMDALGWTQRTSPSPEPAPTSQPRLFDVYDNTTGQTMEEAGTPYTGPVAGLTSEFIDLSPDNLDIAAITPNSFIYSGLGNDAINVGQAGGNNVLDATGGSNFLVGGSGDDTFFLNDLNPAAPIWSTLVNFHAGDAATIWGVTPGDFSFSWVAGEGAGEYTGLTMHVTATGKPAEI
jgi:Ca2+-binding RTX toxin-like protein